MGSILEIKMSPQLSLRQLLHMIDGFCVFMIFFCVVNQFGVHFVHMFPRSCLPSGLFPKYYFKLCSTRQHTAACLYQSSIWGSLFGGATTLVSPTTELFFYCLWSSLFFLVFGLGVRSGIDFFCGEEQVSAGFGVGGTIDARRESFGIAGIF